MKITGSQENVKIIGSRKLKASKLRHRSTKPDKRQTKMKSLQTKIKQ